MSRIEKKSSAGEILVVGGVEKLISKGSIAVEAVYDGRYKIQSSKDKQEILDRLKTKKNKFRLVVIDLDEKEINGLEVLKLIRSLDKNLPVIVVSESEDIRLAVKAAKSGADDFVRKPVTPLRIKESVADIEKKNADEKTRRRLPDSVKLLIEKAKEEMLSKGASLKEAAKDFESQLVILVLNKAKGDRVRASRILGLSDISDFLDCGE